MFGTLASFRRQSLRGLTTAVILNGMLASAAPPGWWDSGAQPVIDPTATPENHGVANIGQAKWMAMNALAALRAVLPDTADLVEADLVGVGKPIASWAAPAPEDREKQRAPLLLGQLKAIAAPFYFHLDAVAPQWIVSERAIYGVLPATGTYPWTSATTDDSNKSVALIGQLKAVFSLDFAADRETGPDADGLPDLWEYHFFSDLASDGSGDPDQDGYTNAQEYTNSTDPTVADANADLDSDGDGLSDFDELTIYGTDPFDSDSDDDGLPDGWEVTWAAQILASGAALTPEQITQLQLGNLEPNEDPADYGSTNAQQYAASGGASEGFYTMVGKRRYELSGMNVNGVTGVANGSRFWFGGPGNYFGESVASTWSPGPLTQIAIDLNTKMPWANATDTIMNAATERAETFYYKKYETTPNVHTTYNYKMGQFQVRLIYDEASTSARSEKFLKFTQVHGEAEAPEQEEIEVVNFTVPANKTTTNTVTVDAPIGAEKYGLGTLVDVDLTLSNGQNSSGPAPGREELVGSFTVANLNDTDNDGVIDKDDNVIKPTPGIPGGTEELDLMELRVRGPDKGRLKVTLVSGAVKFWKKKTKETPVTLTGGAFFIEAADQVDSIWVEATAASTSVRDIQIKLGYEPVGKPLIDDLDVVKATAVWVTESNFVHQPTQSIPADLDALPLSQFWKSSPPTYYPGPFVTPKGPHGGMIVEYTLAPAGIENERQVKFDCARKVASVSFKWVLNSKNNYDRKRLGSPIEEPRGDLVNDDKSATDEDVEPTNRHIYDTDVPGIDFEPDDPLKPLPANLVEDTANFRHWVRVRFDGRRPDDKTLAGSRCSDQEKWHYRAKYGYEIQEGKVVWIGDPNFPTEVAKGHVALPVIPE